MTRKSVMTACPYCNAAQTYDKLHTRVYECGTVADRDTQIYRRACGGKGELKQ
jgi:hypothetical protein